MMDINTNIFRIMLVRVQLQAGRGRERSPFGVVSAAVREPPPVPGCGSV